MKKIILLIFLSLFANTKTQANENRHYCCSVPVLKKQNEGIALGFIGSRILEAGTLFAGVTFLLSVMSLRQAGAGTDALVTNHTLVAMYDRMSLIRTKLYTGFVLSPESVTFLEI